MDNFDNKYKKKNPFSVPDGYFDEITEQILSRVKEEEKPQKVKFLQILKPYLGLVGIFALALFVVQAIFPLFVDENKMLLKNGDEVVQVQETTSGASSEEIFDSNFNPTNEEIIEYLASKVDSYELFYAELY